METISKIELKEKMQALYDSYIRLANTTYENSRIPNLELSVAWQEKSDAYEWTAIVLDQTMATMGVFLKSKETDKRKEVNEMRREECADAENENEIELDENEIIYHENN